MLTHAAIAASATNEDEDEHQMKIDKKITHASHHKMTSLREGDEFGSLVGHMKLLTTSLLRDAEVGLC